MTVLANDMTAGVLNESENPLRILYLNPSSDEAARGLATLESAGVAARADLAASREEYRGLLAKGDYDVTIADGAAGAWTDAEVLEDTLAVDSAPPLIWVCDYSETSVFAEDAGAAEVVWRDRLVQLPGAIRRAVREARLRSERTRAELALRAANQVLTALIRCAPLPITVIDRSGTVNVWNPAAEEVLGWPKEEVLGNSLSQVMPRANGLARLLERSLNEGGVIGAETPQRRKDGATVDLRIFSAPLTDDEGSIQGVIGMLVDITERNLIIEAFRESKERFQSAFVYAPIGMAIGSLEGRIFRVNSAFCRMLGYDEMALLRMHWKDLVLSGDQALLPCLEAASSGQIELRLRHKDGHTVHVQWNTSVIGDAAGQPQYSICQVVDISASKSAQEQIHRYARELERSNRDLQHFAYVASHDLQEPLRMVRGFMDLLARRYQGKLGSDADEYIRYAVDGAARMQHLIRGLLAYSRVGTEGKSFEPVDSGVAVNAALQNLRAALDESRAEVTHGDLPMLPADDVQLAQLFQNLIGNALKFRSTEAPKIHVSATDTGDTWEFSVADNGIGFDPQHATRIFQMFQRLHGQNHYPGTGIGLALCKRIIERHGGCIWADAAPGKGATFHFTVPKEAAPAA